MAKCSKSLSTVDIPIFESATGHVTITCATRHSKNGNPRECALPPTTMFKPTYALRRAVRLQRGAAYSTASSSLNNAQKQPDKPRPEDELSDREWDIQTGTYNTRRH